MRDGLIELIKQARCAKECIGMNDIEVCKATCQTYTTCGIIADYLLKNDVKPVVRCKDCKYRDELCMCCHPRHEGILPLAYPLDFCSYGERSDT